MTGTKDPTDEVMLKMLNNRFAEARGREGEIPAHAFFIRDGEPQGILMLNEMMESMEKKNRIGAVLRAGVKSQNPTIVVLVTETWVVEADPTKPDEMAKIVSGPSPSNHPDRAECLVVQVYRSNGESANYVAKINGTSLGEWVKAEDEFVRWGNPFKPGIEREDQGASPATVPLDDLKTELTAANVKAVFLRCLWGSDEVAQKSRQEIEDRSVKVRGIVQSFGFHPERLAEAKPIVQKLLSQLPDKFREGWSFLNGCMRKDGTQWGEQPDVDMLMSLGIGTGDVVMLSPPEMWSMLPGGVPYYQVMMQDEAIPEGTYRLLDKTLCCPACGKVLDGATSTETEDKRTPEAGDLSVCLYCAEMMVFAKDADAPSGFRLERLTKDAFHALGDETKGILLQSLVTVRELIKRRGQSREEPRDKSVEGIKDSL